MTRLAALLSILALALAPAVQAQTQAPQKLDVLLDWYVNPDHAPLVVVARDATDAAATQALLMLFGDMVAGRLSAKR